MKTGRKKLKVLRLVPVSRRRWGEGEGGGAQPSPQPSDYFLINGLSEEGNTWKI